MGMDAGEGYQKRPGGVKQLPLRSQQEQPLVTTSVRVQPSHCGEEEIIGSKPFEELAAQRD